MFKLKNKTMFNLDTIFNLLRTLLGGLIDKFKAASPSLYTAIVTALLTIEGFILVVLERDIFNPGTENILNIVLVVIAGLLTVIGANEVARRAERFKNVTPKSATRTWVISLLFIGAFVASVWLITKNEKAAAPAEIYLQAAPELDTPEVFSAPAEITNPNVPEGKPTQVWFVQVLYYRLDTLTSVPVGGLPSFKVVTRRDVTIDFPRVLSAGIPPETIFQNVRVPGYPHRDRVINAIILDR